MDHGVSRGSVKYTAIDPGEKSSGIVVLENNRLIFAGDITNEAVIPYIPGSDRVLVEWIRRYENSSAGETTFRTCQMCGDIRNECRHAGAEYFEMTRPDVVIELIGRTRGVSKAIVARAAMDYFPRTGGGKTPVVGTKKQPGPLFLLKGNEHARDALCLYVAWGLAKKRGHLQSSNETRLINPFRER